MSFKTLWAFLLLAAVCAIVPDYAAALAGVSAAGFAFPVRGLTIDKLQQMANPDPRVTGTSEAVTWTWYDTQTYIDAATTRLTFFQTVSVDRSITNMQTQGALPDPMFFQIYYFGLDVLQQVTSAATGAAGAWDNVQRLVLTSRANFTFVISDKEYGPWPLSLCHSSGGVQGFGYNEAAAGTVKSEYANNSVPDGGYCMDGSIVIPPKVGFRLTIDWPAAVNLLATTDVELRAMMHGVLHRRVL